MWQIPGSPQARVELALAEKGWGTQVAVRVSGEDADEEFAGTVLERLLDQLGFAQRRPAVARKWMSKADEAAARGQGQDEASGAIEQRAAPTTRETGLGAGEACEKAREALRSTEELLRHASRAIERAMERCSRNQHNGDAPSDRGEPVPRLAARPGSRRYGPVGGAPAGGAPPGGAPPGAAPPGAGAPPGPIGAAPGGNPVASSA